MNTIKYRITLTVDGSEKDYLEIKNLIETGEFQRNVMDDDGIKKATATIEKLTP